MNLLIAYEIECIFCKAVVTRFYKHKPKHQPQFCTNSCRLKWEYFTGRRKKSDAKYLNSKTTYEWWLVKYGKEEADKKLLEFKKKISDLTAGEKNPMFGRHDHTHGFKRRNSEIKGHSLEEILGEEHARDVKKTLSERMSGDKNPAYGKAYMLGGKSVKGYYKGIFFRSLLEYSFLRHLEENGIDLNNDVEYENWKIEYINSDGHKRTYKPDFYVKSRQTVYEVKPKYAVQKEINQLKFSAAMLRLSSLDLKFKIVTEDDFSKISFQEALTCPDIQWIEKTLSYFKRQ